MASAPRPTRPAAGIASLSMDGVATASVSVDVFTTDGAGAGEGAAAVEGAAVRRAGADAMRGVDFTSAFRAVTLGAGAARLAAMEVRGLAARGCGTS